MFNTADTPTLSPINRSKKTISLTALIDVVFILLMFFMLTSTFIKWHQVELQTASAGKTLTNEQENTNTQLIIIRENAQFSLLTSKLVNSKHEQTFSSFTQLLAQLDPSLPTVLIPEPKITVQKIMTTLSQLKAAKVINTTLGNTLSSEEKKPQ